MSTVIVGIVMAGLFILAIAHIIKSHKKGGCAGGCEGCAGCNLSYDEIKEQIEQSSR